MPQAGENREIHALAQTGPHEHRRLQALVTIVTPCLNSASTIEDNVQSVLAAREALSRNGWELEHLIVDGGSVDGTTELVSSHAAKHSFCHLISNICGGPYPAMNAGLQKANGHYTHVLNSDDLILDPEAYGTFLQEAKTKESTVLIASIAYFKRPSSQLKSLWRVQPIPKNITKWRQQLLKGLHYPHPGFIAETNLYRSEAFDERYSLSADYKLMQQILLGLARPDKTHLCRKPIVAMAEGGATGSWRAIFKGWKQLRAINQELGIQASSTKRYWEKAKRRLRPSSELISIETHERHRSD